MDTTTTTETTALLPDPVDYDRRTRNEDTRTAASGCHICGRGMSDAQVEKAWHVETILTGDLIPEAARFTREDSLGAFPVGSECARKVPAAYRFRVA